jgi:2-polyprenyl-6-methoxyphenol hydroxylase-like FAD-dependent oxidoreductase
MKRIIAAGSVAALAMVGFAGTASAKPESDPRPVEGGIECQQAGIGTLQTLGLLPAVAKGGIEVKDVGVLSFQTVLSLHRTKPELFQTGGVIVIVGEDEVPATWCDGV